MTDHANIIRLAEGYMKWHVMSNFSGAFCDLQGAFVHWIDNWNPFESHTDAYELESAIPEAKRAAYLFTLAGPIVSANRLAAYWKLAHATPRQRSQAALAVLNMEER